MRSLLRLILIFVLCSLPIPALAVAPAHFWSFHAGSPEGSNITDVAVMPATGDFVITGDASGTSVNFGGHDWGIQDGHPNLYVARYTNRGQLKWAQVYATTSASYGGGVAIDAAGNVYISSSFYGSIDIDNTPEVSNGGADLLIAKFDPNGNPLWSNHFGGAAGDEGAAQRSLAMDAAGNLFVTGYFTAATNLGGGARAAAAGKDIFIAKYSTAGNWVWDIEAGSSGDDEGLGITTDPSGNVYASGYFVNSMSLSGQLLTSAGGIDGYLAKYSNDGLIQWSQRRGGTGDDFFEDVAADASGNVVITGGFQNSVNFGGGTLNTAGGYDGFLAKYNTSGVHQWSFRYGGAGEELGVCIAIDAFGKVVLGAGIDSPSVDMGGVSVLATGSLFDCVFAKYSSSGALVWARAAGGGNNDLPSAVGADAAGNVYFGGGFSQNIDLGGGTLAFDHGGNLFCAKYGVGEPGIASIVDVGNDQGRNVRISINRSLLDDGTATHPVKEYQAFRRVLPLPPSAMKGLQPVPNGTWEFVGSVPASGAKSYKIIAPTLADSTIAFGIYRTKFYVRAATDDPVTFFDSPADSGYSKDNLAPSIPQNFMFNTGDLSWKESPDRDFDYFTVYGSNSNSFASATLINYTTTTGMDVGGQPYSYYYVTATDFAGNEGKPAKALAISGVGGTPGSYVLSVSAYPNPFNPETTVRYTLPAKGQVLLEVYDLRGEKVATLVSETKDAGAYTATWRGLGDTGATVSSGVYFAKLSTPAGERSYKLVLLK
jgi:hypothetical protein